MTSLSEIQIILLFFADTKADEIEKKKKRKFSQFTQSNQFNFIKRRDTLIAFITWALWVLFFLFRFSLHSMHWMPVHLDSYSIVWIGNYFNFRKRFFEILRLQLAYFNGLANHWIEFDGWTMRERIYCSIMRPITCCINKMFLRRLHDWPMPQQFPRN